MTELLSHIQNMVSTTSSGLLTILAIAAALAITIFVIMGIFAGNDQDKAQTVKTLVIILIFCAIAGAATALVKWASGS